MPQLSRSELWHDDQSDGLYSGCMQDASKIDRSILTNMPDAQLAPPNLQRPKVTERVKGTKRLASTL